MCNRPSIVKAYYANEVGTNDRMPVKHYIPADLLTIEIVTKDGKYFLALPEGFFLIQYQDLKGNTYKQYYYQVKL